jgi:moderate conductance mechanosensitive channel
MALISRWPRRFAFLTFLVLLIGGANFAVAQIPPGTLLAPKPTAAEAKNNRAGNLDDKADGQEKIAIVHKSWWEHSLIIVAILTVAAIILWIANRLHGRLVRLLSGRDRRGTVAENENRARTLVGVLHAALRTVVIAVALIMVLEEIGVKVGALLGGVAIAGLAVAFGAQSLIKDYFTGFLVLLEQQYMIGDVVKISGITGQVEKITLRITVLRDVEGAVHFIPHGQITLVSNLTHDWSQAVFDLIVAASENVERVRDTFFALARELREDSTFGPMILDDPKMLGVDALGDATYTVKFSLRTLPLKRWEVKRELLRRMKTRFQELQVKVTVPA